MRLDLALIRLHPQLSRRRARAAIEKGQVSVDGACVREAGHPVPADAVVAWNPHRKALPRARCSLPAMRKGCAVGWCVRRRLSRFYVSRRTPRFLMRRFP